MQNKRYRYNSKRYKLALRKDEERLNRIHLRCLIDELHQLSFISAVKASENILRDGSNNPERQILNAFELYQFIQLLRRHLSEPGTDLGLESGWQFSEHSHLTIVDLIKALSPESQQILKDKKIEL